MEKPMTRQRRWQLKKSRRGLCEQCGEKASGKIICDPCSAKKGTKKRHPTKAEYDAVDWQLKNTELAEILKVNTHTITNQRKLSPNRRKKKS